MRVRAPARTPPTWRHQRNAHGPRTTTRRQHGGDTPGGGVDPERERGWRGGPGRKESGGEIFFFIKFYLFFNKKK